MNNHRVIIPWFFNVRGRRPGVSPTQPRVAPGDTICNMPAAFGPSVYRFFPAETYPFAADNAQHKIIFTSGRKLILKKDRFVKSDPNGIYYAGTIKLKSSFFND
jgi:hypothetical protein